MAFVIHVDSYFTGFIGLARTFVREKQFEPYFVFPRDYPNVAAHIAICGEEEIPYGILFHRVTAASNSADAHVAHRPRLISRLKMRIDAWSSFPRELKTLIARLIAVQRAVRRINPGLLVLGGDIVGHDMALFIRAGHRIGVRSVVMASWMASSREPAESNMQDERTRVRGLLRRIFVKAYPKWGFRHNEVTLLRLPLPTALATQLLGLTPPLPWVLHSGNADVIAVESKAARDYGISLGLPPDKLRVIGSPIHDTLALVRKHKEQGRAGLCVRTSLSPHRPIVLVALPPDMVSARAAGRECDFGSYGELLSFWIRSIRDVCRGNVLFSMHPSATASEIETVRTLGARVVESHIAEVIPLCDIYVASISATIQWATACAIPVVNYDVYRYRYTDYESLPGVIRVERRQDFLQELGRLFGTAQHRLSLQSLQATVANDWGVLDGRATDRIVQLFEELIP